MNTHKNKTQQTSTKRRSVYLLTGSIIAFLLIATPYIFYSYESFPETDTWETFLFTYTTDQYYGINVFFWTVLGKFVPLYLLTIWFLTCKHWWYHAILIPIAMYLFQLVSALNDDIKFFDNFEFWYVFPIMIVVTPLVYLIRAKLLDTINNPTLEELEMDLLQKKNIFQIFKDLFR